MSDTSIYGRAAKSLWIRSAVISKQLDNSLGAVHGIGFAEYMVLMNLVRAPHQQLRRIDIAESVARTASAITRMLLPLEKIGLVEKASSERDARVSLVKITASGIETYENATETLSAKSESLLNGLSIEEAGALLRLLQKL